YQRGGLAISSLWLPSSQLGPDSRYQLAVVKRLGNVVVRSQLEAPDDILFTIAAGEHDDGDIRAFTQLGQQVEGAFATEVYVQDHNIGAVESPECAGGIVGRHGFEASALKDEHQQVDEVSIVVHQENMHV